MNIQVTIINLTKEKKAKYQQKFISDGLKTSLERALARNELSVVFVNRKGYSNAVYCRECGKARKCPECSISLVYHREENLLKCPYCAYTENYSQVCKCKSSRLSFLGLGTERAVSIIGELFPQARIIKFDRDAIQNDEERDRVLEEINTGNFDIIVATQFLFSFKETILRKNISRKFTLAAVADIDTSLHSHDYRSAEHTFRFVYNLCDFITQGGELVVQANNTKHYIFNAIKKLDWKKFYNRELSLRKELFYPPYSKLIYSFIESSNEQNTGEETAAFENFLKKNIDEDMSLLGPIEIRPSRKNIKSGRQFLLKVPPDKLGSVCRKLAEYKPAFRAHIYFDIET